MARKIAPMHDKLFQKVLVADGCWLWLGAKNQHGYGIISMGRGGDRIRAHRACYEYLVGPIPEGMVLCHKCDNPQCVNPSHLFPGTMKDNTADMWAKGRGYTPFRGRFERQHHNCKMLNDDVARCREMYATGAYSTRQLSEHFGVSTTHIRRIVTEKLRASV